MRIRLTEDCEHGEKGKVLEVDESKVAEFLAQGRCEVVPDEPVVSAPPPEPAPKEEPPKVEPPPKEPTKLHKPKGRR